MREVEENVGVGGVAQGVVGVYLCTIHAQYHLYTCGCVGGIIRGYSGYYEGL